MAAKGGRSSQRAEVRLAAEMPLSRLRGLEEWGRSEPAAAACLSAGFDSSAAFGIYGYSLAFTQEKQAQCRGSSFWAIITYLKLRCVQTRPLPGRSIISQSRERTQKKVLAQDPMAYLLFSPSRRSCMLTASLISSISNGFVKCMTAPKSVASLIISSSP